jgi:signal transduction histidine kinase
MSLSLRHPLRVGLMVGAAALVNLIPIELPGDVRLFLGSLVYMPLVLVLPWPWAILAAAIPMAVTTEVLGHPLALMIAVAEAAWLKIPRFARYRRSVLIRDGLFWAIITVPAFYGLYYRVANFPMDLVVIIAVKQIVNQLTAVGVASFVVRQTTFPIWLNNEMVQRRRMRDMVSHSVFILAVIPLVVVGVGVAMLLRAYCVREDFEVLTSTGQRATQQLDQFLVDHQAAVASAASIISRGGDPAVVLEETKRAHPAFITMLIADQEGRITATDPRAARNRASVTQVADREYFQRARDTDSIFLSGVFRGRGFGRDILVAISAPIHDESGKFIGVLEGSLEVHNFAHLVANLDEDIDVIQADRTGKVIFAEPETGLKPLDLLRDFPQGSALGKAKPIAFQTAARGENARITALAVRADRSGVIVVAQRPVLAGLAGSEWLLCLFPCAAAAVGLAAWWVTRTARQKMAMPLERFTKGTMEQAARRTVEPFDFQPTDAPYEVVMVFHSFNQLAVRIQGAYAMMRTANEDLDRRVAQRTEEAETARRAAEQANQSKTDFLAMTSHEIRTPLNAIIGLAESLSATASTPVVADRLKTIRQSGQRLLHVVNDLLDLSKIEAGKLEIRSAAVRLGSLCDEVRELFALQAAQQGITLTVECDRSLPSHVFTDRIRLQQILINLMGNALKFTTKGAVRLRVGKGISEGRKVSVRFSVTDSGPGISAEQQSRLFLPYVQLETATQSGAKGTGLGLAISRRLVDLLGGSLAVRSEVGAGAEFYFTLLLEPAIAEAPVQSTGLNDRVRGLRVMAVDDDGSSLFPVGRGRKAKVNWA